ncbi:5'-nucleotidase [Arachnia propionica]|uniref:5'-nucleotidase n=1 Tax=Arachnia propionica TaxID=1750 RepID=UPI0021AB4257|nr:5'-nucleotidase [Arachnia propionica]MDO5084393.1 5'-nucleotidase [Arachnia propionica]
MTLGVASSALFDLSESDAVFQQEGPEAYRHHQREHLDDPLPAGSAQPFIRRLLGLNRVVQDAVDVIVMSRNSPETGLRVMRSIETAGLPISRALFREGRSSFEFMPSLGMSLFLTSHADDVTAALRAGHPAGRVVAGQVDDEGGEELRVAFDFDGVLADDSSERIYQEDGLTRFTAHETAMSTEPLPQGPLAGFLQGLNRIQAAEAGLEGHTPLLRIALVTARSAPAHERAVNSLLAWGLRVDEAFFLGGRDKGRVLDVLRPHIFFDDQERNLQGLKGTPAVHIPFGVANQG